MTREPVKEMTAERLNKLFRSMETKDLLKSGDAFTELYRYLRPNITKHISRKYGNEELAQEVAQIFFNRLVEKRFTKNIVFPLGWVYTNCENIAKDIFKADSRYQQAVIKNTEALCESAIDAFDSALSAECIEQIEKLDDIAASRIIKMHLLEDYSLKEISVELCIRYGTVRQKYARGIKKLQKFYNLV